MEYAIGIIIQNTDTLTKVKTLFNKLNLMIEKKSVIDEQDRYSIKGIADTEIQFFIGVARGVPSIIKNILNANNDGVGELYLPVSRCMWFDGQDYTYAEMQQRLKQWIGFEWKEKYYILPVNFSTTNLLTKFVNY